MTLQQPGDLATAVRRNTVVLALCLTLSWAVVQLQAALGAVTLAVLSGNRTLVGLAPAIALSAWAVATLLVGPLMDSRGRGPGLRLGFLAGAIGCLASFAATRAGSTLGFLVSMALLGASAGAVNLARAGGADMYPPERRARGISFILLGAAFGAILGPLAFTPLLSGARRDLMVLSAPWIPATAVMLLGAALTLAIRPDPVRIARQLRFHRYGPEASGAIRPVRELLRLPRVQAALLAALVAQGVMSSMMGILAVAMVDHGHDLAVVAVTMSAHFLGMFGLVIVAGQIVDRVGRERAILAGMLLLAAGDLGFLAGLDFQWALPAMFLLGVGWNLAYVAATTMLADATRPRERAKLLGFVDFVAFLVAAGATVLAGALLAVAGLRPLVAAATGVSLLPVLLFLVRLRPVRALESLRALPEPVGEVRVSELIAGEELGPLGS